MAWSNVGNLKGPKGDVGDVLSSIQQGVVFFAEGSSTAAEAMLASKKWSLLGKFTIYVNPSTHDIDFFPSSSATKSHVLYAFVKA